MMDKKKIAYLVALLALVIFSIAYRFPNTPHQNLPDSTNYHYMTTMVNIHGGIPWIVDPILGNFGFVPISSSPTGFVYILSTITQLTGLEFEPSILVLNYITAMLLTLAGFLIGRKILKNNIMGLLTAYFFTTTLVILRSTTFAAAPRGLISVFLPLVLLTLMCTIEYDIKKVTRKKMAILFFLILLGAMFIHKIIYLFVPVIIAYLFYITVYPKLNRLINPFFTKISISARPSVLKIGRMSLFSTLFGGFIILAIQYGGSFFTRPVFLTQSSLFEGESLFIMTLNFFVRLARNIRLGIIFSAIGFLLLSIKRKNNGEFFTYIGLISIIPFSIRLAYIYNIWGLFMAIFAGYGAYIIGRKILCNGRKIFYVSIVAILLLSVIIIPPFVTVGEPYYDDPVRKTHVETEEIESAIYLKYTLNSGESFVTSPGFHSHIFTGITEKVSLNLGGHQFYLIDNSTIEENIEFQPIFQEGFDLERYYHNKGLLYRIRYDPLFPELGYWRPRHSRLFQREFGSGDRYQSIVDTYNINMVVINRNLIEPRGGPHSMSMYESLMEEEYLLYKNTYFDFYPVQ